VGICAISEHNSTVNCCFSGPWLQPNLTTFLKLLTSNLIIWENCQLSEDFSMKRMLSFLCLNWVEKMLLTAETKQNFVGVVSCLIGKTVIIIPNHNSKTMIGCANWIKKFRLCDMSHYQKKKWHHMFLQNKVWFGKLFLGELQCKQELTLTLFVALFLKSEPFCALWTLPSHTWTF